MNYKQAMKQKCKCGKFAVGGWQGNDKAGNPIFSRISSKVILPYGIMMTEEHTIYACFVPQQIA